MESHKLGVGTGLFVWLGEWPLVPINSHSPPPPAAEVHVLNYFHPFCFFGHIFGPDLLEGVLQEAYSKVPVQYEM